MRRKVSIRSATSRSSSTRWPGAPPPAIRARLSSRSVRARICWICWRSARRADAVLGWERLFGELGQHGERSFHGVRQIAERMTSPLLALVQQDQQAIQFVHQGSYFVRDVGR
ncbi:MAG: hypothetical protein R3F36_00035 [Candidatus Competibacteraceae bacterium]